MNAPDVSPLPPMQAAAQLTLKSLAPRFKKKQHGLYVEILADVIETQPSVRNIALTGAYGTGKSSILGEIARRYSGRVVELSLSTVGDGDDTLEPGFTGNPAASTATNRIQKEIVKQILYSEDPAKMRGSRYRRITRFRFWREVSAAFLLSAVVMVFLLLSGLAGPFVAGVGEETGLLPLAYVGLFVLFGTVVVTARWATHNRVFIEKLSAGQTTVSLSPQSMSYFDQYLDEIVFYFESSGRDIVIFEDIDRFENVQIFETLRALNTLLNGAQQIRSRKRSRSTGSYLREAAPVRKPKGARSSQVKFIYALRDSVFERLGRDSDHTSAPDDARAETERANRTKFFDLVIPVVPFITHRNARDLMSKAMQKTDVSEDLIDLAAKHVADMRLIRNVRNEFDVFHRRLIETKSRMPDLDADRLFAMILYKNVHMSDFEAIRFGTSKLDELHKAWRSLVNQNIEAGTQRLRRISKQLESSDSLETRSANLGHRLQEVAEMMASATRLDRIPQVSVDGTVVDATQMKTAQFWADLVRDRQTIVINAAPGVQSRSSTFTFEMLPTLLGADITSQTWEPGDRTQLESEVRRLRASIDFLRHHTWAQLYARPEFTQPGPTVSVDESFRDSVNRIVGSRLTQDLVSAGQINNYFALYISNYYGKHLRQDALNYIIRAVDQGVSDPLYTLTTADVEAIISDKGPGVLKDRSMLNVTVFDHLLSVDAARSEPLIEQLVVWGAVERHFVDQYLTYGDKTEQLVEYLSPRIPELITYLVSEAPIDADARKTLIDCAIKTANVERVYRSDPAVRDWFEANFADLHCLTKLGLPGKAEGPIKIIAQSGARFTSVAPLSPDARKAVVESQCYVVTEENLLLLSGASGIALDELSESNKAVYAYALQHDDEYRAALRNSIESSESVVSHENFEAILVDVASAVSPDAFAEIVQTAAQGCNIADLGALPSVYWAPLVEDLRVPTSFSNVTNYLNHVGVIDPTLARLLHSTGSIAVPAETSQTERVALAQSLLAARDVLPEAQLRVQTVVSLELADHIPTSDITAEPGSLIGLLIRNDVIADDVAAFAGRLMVDWGTFKVAMLSSQKFASMLSPGVLPAKFLAEFFPAADVSIEFKRAVLSELTSYASTTDIWGLQRAAEFALHEGSALDYPRLSLMASGVVSAEVLVKLIAAAPEIGDDELQALLSSMTGDYPLIAERGNRRPLLPDDGSHRHLLTRLQEMGIVNRFGPDGKRAGLRVSLKKE
jgi:hypothetical protein